MASFKAYIRELNSLSPEPGYEPDVDERDEKEEREIRETEDLSKGAVMKGVVQPGHGEARPKDGDLVLLHYTVRDGSSQRIVASTRPEEGGAGQPHPFLVGKGLRMPRGWELALYDMQEGERAALRVRWEYGYGHKGCGLPPPPGLDKRAEQLVDLTLVALHPKDKGVRTVGAEGQCFKRPLVESEEWENPREPYEVDVLVTMRVASSSGASGEGKVVYSTGDTPLHFAIGDGSVPKGVEECVCSMYRAERSVFWVPGSAACGGSSLPDPPAGVRWLEYEIQLQRIVQVRDLTGRGELMKRRLRDGVGQFPMDCPLEDSHVRLHFKVRAAGDAAVLHDTRGPDGCAAPLEFDSGMGVVPDAVDVCSRLMLPGEVALVRSNWEHAYMSRDDCPAGLQAGQDAEFEVELVGFDKNPAWVEMSVAQKLVQALQLKEQGNQLFKQGQYTRCEQKYMKSLRVLNSATPEAGSQEEAEALSRHKTGVMVNMAMVSFRQQDYGETITWCNKAIREDPEYPKAYFRRAAAHGMLGRLQEAADDLAVVAALDPGLQADVDRELARMQQRVRAGEAKQRREMGSFLNKRG